MIMQNIKEKINIQPYFMAAQEGYTVIYNLTCNFNKYYEEKALWEYGIECSLYNSNDELVSEGRVNCISPNREIVINIIYTLVNNVVFPVHLKDVILNILNA